MAGIYKKDREGPNVALACQKYVSQKRNRSVTNVTKMVLNLSLIDFRIQHQAEMKHGIIDSVN